MTPTRLVLKSIEPITLAKTSGYGYGAVGLVIGSIVSLIAFLSPALVHDGGPVAAWVGFFAGVSSVIVFPLLYGGLGFVLGFIAAAIYNWLAGRAGGIECQVELPPPAQS